MTLNHEGTKDTKKGINRKSVLWPKTLSLCVFVLALGVVGSTWAQTVLPGAGSVTPLSALGASARADALGDAMVGLGDDPSAIFFNPAGLSQLSSADLSLHHNSYLAGAFEETLLFGLPTAPLGGFAGALQYVVWGDLDRRDAFGVPQGNFTDSDVAFSVGWGMAVAPDLSVGLALQGVQQKIIDNLYTGLSSNLGLLFVPVPGFRMGVAFSGLGTDLAGSWPARDLHLGISARIPLGPGSQLQPLVAGDWQAGGVSRLQAGVEGTVERDFFLRVGYQAPLTDNQIGGLTGLTSGAGFRSGQFRLDYAFLPDGDLGTSHRVSVGYEFPNAPPPPRPVTVTAPVTVQGPPVTVVAPPPATPVPVPGTAKSKVEVHFELPGAGAPVTTDSGASSLLGVYEKAAQENPSDSRAWRNLGIAYLKMGRKALGLQCLEQALRLDPADAALKQWLEDYRAKHPPKDR